MEDAFGLASEPIKPALLEMMFHFVLANSENVY